MREPLSSNQRALDCALPRQRDREKRKERGCFGRPRVSFCRRLPARVRRLVTLTERLDASARVSAGGGEGEGICACTGHLTTAQRRQPSSTHHPPLPLCPSPHHHCPLYTRRKKLEEAFLTQRSNAQPPQKITRAKGARFPKQKRDGKTTKKERRVMLCSPFAAATSHPQNKREQGDARPRARAHQVDEAAAAEGRGQPARRRITTELLHTKVVCFAHNHPIQKH